MHRLSMNIGPRMMHEAWRWRLCLQRLGCGLRESSSKGPRRRIGISLSQLDVQLFSSADHQWRLATVQQVQKGAVGGDAPSRVVGHACVEVSNNGREC